MLCTRTLQRRNHFSTTFQFFHNNHKKSVRLLFFHIFLPRKGTLTDAGDGDGAGGGNKTHKITPKQLFFYISALEGNFDRRQGWGWGGGG